MQASNKHGNADALSQLPLDTDEGSNDEVTDTVCLLEQQQLSDLPIKVADIQLVNGLKFMRCLKQHLKLPSNS